MTKITLRFYSVYPQLYSIVSELNPQIVFLYKETMRIMKWKFKFHSKTSTIMTARKGINYGRVKKKMGSYTLNFQRNDYDIQEISFKTWIKPIQLYSLEGNTITLIVS